METQEDQRQEELAAPLLLDTDGAARLLGISPRTVQGWVRQKRIPFVKLGNLTRFRPSALQQWIEDQEIKAEPINIEPINADPTSIAVAQVKGE